MAGHMPTMQQCKGWHPSYASYVDVYDTQTGISNRYENPTGGSSTYFPADAMSFRNSCP